MPIEGERRDAITPSGVRDGHAGGATVVVAMLTCGRLAPGSLDDLLGGFGLEVRWIADGEPIPGSYWGDGEAGLIGARVLVRSDTPVHSALHEACHSICMGEERRAALDTDAGGDDLEECAACYLQILLAGELPGVGDERLMDDMDAWGYSFRLGSTRRWWLHDAADARAWLLERGLIDTSGRILRPSRRERGGSRFASREERRDHREAAG